MSIKQFHPPTTKPREHPGALSYQAYLKCRHVELVRGSLHLRSALSYCLTMRA